MINRPPSNVLFSLIQVVLFATSRTDNMRPDQTVYHISEELVSLPVIRSGTLIFDSLLTMGTFHHGFQLYNNQ